MPKTLEEISKDLETLNSSVGMMKKDFEVKLKAAKSDADEWKALAEKNEADAKKFKEAATKAEEEKAKAYQEGRIKEMKAFLEDAVKTARITPAAKVMAERLMESMTSDATIHTFEAKDGSKTSHTQLSLFKEFINALQKSKVFTVLTQQPKAESSAPVTESTGEQRFMEVKKEGATQSLVVDDYDLGVKALDYQQEMAKIGRKVDYADALIAVSKIQKVQE